MNPYLTAFREYEKHDRGVSWTDALDFHFQHGAVISTAEAFVMARPVAWSWKDHLHTSLDFRMENDGHNDCWHVWCVAGDLAEALRIGGMYGVKLLTFQRHGQERLRRVELVHLFRRVR
jgi:hypothetical protein